MEIKCNRCGHKPMGKRGGAFSGKVKHQRYKCAKCGYEYLNIGELYTNTKGIPGEGK